jgi:hypothetical protein
MKCNHGIKASWLHAARIALLQQNLNRYTPSTNCALSATLIYFSDSYLGHYLNVDYILTGITKGGINMAWDPVTTTNFVLCIVILALGIWAYVRKRNDVPLYIGIAFGLFAVSHIMTLLGLAAGLTVFLIIIRLIAYLLVVAALCRILVKK